MHPLLLGRSALLLLLAACPGPSATTESTGTTDGTATTDPASTSSSSEPDPTIATSIATSTPTGTSTTDPTTTTGTTTGTTTDTTTGGPDDTGDVHVLYLLATDTPGDHSELRWLTITGDTPGAPTTVLSAPAGGALRSLFVSRSRARVAVNSVDANDVAGLWLVDPAAGTAAAVALPPEAPAIRHVQFSPDDRYLVLAGGISEINLDTIYACELGPDLACALAPVSAPIDAGRLAQFVAVSPASTWLAYGVDPPGLTGIDFMLAPLAAPGPATTLLSLEMSTGWIDKIHFTADESFLYFAANPDAIYSDIHYAVDLGGAPPAPVPLHAAPMPDLNARADLAPDAGALALWTGDNDGGTLARLPVDGASAGPATDLSGPAAGQIQTTRLWAPDSAHLVFTADHEVADLDQLYLVTADGGAPDPVKINLPLAPGEYLDCIDTPPGSAGAIHCIALGAEDFTHFVWTSFADPDTPVPINAPVGRVSGIDVWSFDGSRLLYVGDQDTLDHRELYLVEFDAGMPGAPIKINSPVPGDVDPRPQFSPDGARVVYKAGTQASPAALFTVLPGREGAPPPALALSEPDEHVGLFAVLPAS